MAPSANYLVRTASDLGRKPVACRVLSPKLFISDYIGLSKLTAEISFIREITAHWDTAVH